MKKIMIAGLGLSLLSGTAVFAQNSTAGSGGQMGNGTTTTKKHKKHKKSKKSDQMGTDSSAAPKA